MELSDGVNGSGAPQRVENVSVADGKLKLSLQKGNGFKALNIQPAVLSVNEAFTNITRLALRYRREWDGTPHFWMMRNDDSRKLELDACEQDSITPSGYATNVHTFVFQSPMHFGAKRIATLTSLPIFIFGDAEFTPTHGLYYFDGEISDTRSLEKVEPDDLNIWLTTIAAPLGKTEKS